MRCAAPGKLVLTGAYAVLEGAPAIVCAVTRYAYAFDGDGAPTTEVVAALQRPTAIDASELSQGKTKLGLGSSAAALVAAIALRLAERGEDVETAPMRRAIFARAREVHARVQGGGSGVDVAASTFGGVLRYRPGEAEAVELPHGIHVAAFFSGSSARTSTLRERVDALKANDARSYAALMATLATIARDAEAAVHAKRSEAFVDAVAATGPALAALGTAADAPIVPPAFVALGEVARRENAAFIPSGAGGGDVGVFVGTNGPSASFIREADGLGMKAIALGIDTRGVRIEGRNASGRSPS